MGSLPISQQTASPSHSSLQAQPNLSSLPPFEILFSITLTCTACIDSVRTAVLAIPGILSAELSLEKQTLRTRGTAAPSEILAAIQSTGRDAVVRGTGGGAADTNGISDGMAAAVAILEDYEVGQSSTRTTQGSPVRGLARIVQVSAASKEGRTEGTGEDEGIPALSIIDISLSGLAAGIYEASIRQTGDISRGSQSVGAAWRAVPGQMVVGEDGMGSAVVVGSGWEVWEIVGRAFAVERVGGSDSKGSGDGKRSDGSGSGDGSEKGAEMVLGVIARSAGVWDNDKMVCSCSGKTVWEERVEQRGRGML